MSTSLSTDVYPSFPWASNRAAALEYLRREGKSTDGWEKFDEKDGVVYEKKTIAGDTSVIPVVRGTGVIDGFSPRQFLSLITYPGARSVWDPRTEKAEAVKRFGFSLTEFYAVQKGFGWIVSPRDIVGFQDTIYSEDGVLERVQSSVDDPDMPPVSGRVRGTLTVAGWVLKPIPSGSEVTYVVKFDPNGSIPTSIINRVVVPEIPAAISRCGGILRSRGYPPFVINIATLKSILLSEDFDYESKTFQFQILGSSSDALRIMFDRKMYPKAPEVILDGEGKNDAEIHKGEEDITVKLSTTSEGRQISIVLSD